DAPSLPPPAEGDDTYSIKEIRDAGRGIFGTITAEFAGAINYAFKQFGQPNAYIVGKEGGGAFLAGLRYGKGKMHRKGASVKKIYWQGPSAGLDLGAQSSRTFFLVYNLDDPNTLYGRFSGIGGDAYVAGGIGITVLGKGKVIIVPIRSGVGLRIGANLSYLKFTDHQTWNPF
ncbi:MAG: EipA family protein, partial [Alphaproteobacteria bacterium]